MIKVEEHITGTSKKVKIDDQLQLEESTSPGLEDMHGDEVEEEDEHGQGQHKFHSVFNVIMMGDSGVGKTDLIGRLCKRDDFKTQFFTTIGINMESCILEMDGHKSNLQIWDPSGSERFRKGITQYFPIAKGIVFVYDVNYDKSFQSIQQWIRLVEAHPNINPLLPKCLIGNKCDIPLSRRRILPSQGENLAAAYGMRFFETSSISGANVHEAFTALCQDMRKHTGTTTTVPSQSAKTPI